MGKNKRSKAYYIQNAKRQKKAFGVLGPDMVGFLGTCNAHERDCVREAYNLLNEYAKNLYGEEFSESKCSGAIPEESTNDMSASAGSVNADILNADSDSEGDEDLVDIEAAIKADVTELKEKTGKGRKHRRFQQVTSGAKNCIFVRTTIEDPLPLSLAIMDDLLLTQKQKTKKLIRMLPVHGTCKANPDDIKRTVGKLAASYFQGNPQTYCVNVKVRNNTTFKKENIVGDLANILQNANSENRANLIVPEVVLGVNVLRSVCCLSFLPHYFTKFCKYNLVLLADKNKTGSENNVKDIKKETTVDTDATKGAEVVTEKETTVETEATKGAEVDTEKETTVETEATKGTEVVTEKETTVETDATKGAEVDTENNSDNNDAVKAEREGCGNT